MRQITLFMLPLAFLVACATPQERCIAVASKDLRVVRALISETEGNLERRYAIRQDTVPNFTMSFCNQNGVLTTCLNQTTTTVDKPVVIDFAAERKNLKELRTKERELGQRATVAAQQCQVDYP
ncbi:MAG: hypothetical protein P8Q99_08245 [Paracoccaceae bacterium]|nr:hypothetical protein [Paracoccaceae bacterium]